MTPDEVRSVLLDAATEEEFMALSRGIMLAYKRQTPKHAAANHVALLGVVYDSITTMRWYFGGKTTDMKEAVHELRKKPMVKALKAAGLIFENKDGAKGIIPTNMDRFEEMGYLKRLHRGYDYSFELIYAEE